MQSSYRTEATILPGHRLELNTPGLPEGARVEVTVVLSKTSTPQFHSALEFLESLPVGPIAFPNWQAYEQHLREERDSWDR